MRCGWSRLCGPTIAPDTIGAFYTELGNRTHEAGTPLTDDIVVQAAYGGRGRGPESGARRLPLGRGGPRVARDGTGPGRSGHRLAGTAPGKAPRAVLHGPIIGAVPGHDEALAMWDAVVPLMRIDTFFEAKRGREVPSHSTGC